MRGILAESTGLGKTVEIIACILANPRTRQPASIEGRQACHADEAISIYRFKTTIESRAMLIVTPASILSQWEREISRHTTNLEVVVYSGILKTCAATLRLLLRKRMFIWFNLRMLADVLVTFEVLSCDSGHTDGNYVSIQITLLVVHTVYQLTHQGMF